MASRACKRCGEISASLMPGHRAETHRRLLDHLRGYRKGTESRHTAEYIVSYCRAVVELLVAADQGLCGACYNVQDPPS